MQSKRCREGRVQQMSTVKQQQQQQRWESVRVSGIAPAQLLGPRARSQTCR